MADSGQKFIKRNRPPRVQIEYKEPTSERMVELPFVMGVLADLSGNASEVEKPPMEERDFLDIDMDNFDKRMAAIEPAINFRVDSRLGEGGDNEGKLGLQLKFRKMADLEPAAVAKQVPPLAKLLEARQQLANLQRFMDGKAAAEEQIRTLLKDPQLMRLLAEKKASEAPQDEESAE